MNYFEWFELPVSFKIDLFELKKKFYQKSRDVHPDYHTKTSVQEQLTILDKASLNNQAYKTLADFDACMKYVLELQGQLAPEGQNKVPDDFLFEMMDLNEVVMELQLDSDIAKMEEILAILQDKEATLNAPVQHLLEAELVEDFSEKDWSLLVEYYLKRRYLHRLKVNLSKALKNRD